MNRSSLFIATATCATILSALFILSPTSSASDAAIVSTQAPLQMTLLPTVHVTANASDADSETSWNIADASPLRVTLMPTVSVFASSEALAVTTLPTVHVVAQVEPAPIQQVAAIYPAPTIVEALTQVSTSSDLSSETERVSQNRNLLVTPL